MGDGFTALLQGGVRSSMFPDFLPGPKLAAETGSANGVYDVSPVSFSVGGCPFQNYFYQCGPGDHGAATDFAFPPHATGAGYEFFRLFFGTATSEGAPLASLSAVDAEDYSIGGTSEDVILLGPLYDPAMNFIFGFRDVLFVEGFETGDTSIWSDSSEPPL